MNVFGNGMDGVGRATSKQTCEHPNKEDSSLDLSTMSISNRNCADAPYFSISSVSSDLRISMRTSPTECELNVGDEVVLMEINTYSETNEGAFHFDRISQASIVEQKLPPVEDVTKLRTDEVLIDLENSYGAEGHTVHAEPGTLAAWGNPDYDVWAFRYVPQDGRLPITNDFFSDPLPGPAKWAYPARLKNDTMEVRVVKIKDPPDWIVNATRIQRVPNYKTLVVETNVTLTHSGGTLFVRSAQSITIEGTISMYANGPYTGGTYWNYGKFASYQGLAKDNSGGTGGNGALEYCGVTDCVFLASGCTSGDIGTNGGGSGGHGNDAWITESGNDNLVNLRGGGGGSGSCGGRYVIFENDQAFTHTTTLSVHDKNMKRSIQNFARLK